MTENVPCPSTITVAMLVLYVVKRAFSTKYFRMSDNKAEDQLNSLVKQLQESTKVNKEVSRRAAEEGLAPEDVEEFVVKNSGELINQSLDTLREVKDYVMASGDPDSIGALADLIKASSSALESLNKIVVQNKRSATSILTKKMDIDTKLAIENEKPDKNSYIGTRDEVFKQLVKDAKVIEVTEDDLDTSLSGRP